MHRRTLTLATALLLAGGGAFAQQTPPAAPPRRLRGTIESVDGNRMVIKSRDGASLTVTLAENATVAALRKVELGQIAPGAFIGTATRPGTGGIMVAIEVLVFPEDMRGRGEGHYAWDLEPGSMMTNATVSGTVSLSQGRELSLTIKDQTYKVVVPPDAPVVTFAPASRADLKPGMRVFAVATAAADGALSAARVTVEKDGVAPPM